MTHWSLNGYNCDFMSLTFSDLCIQTHEAYVSNSAQAAWQFSSKVIHAHLQFASMACCIWWFCYACSMHVTGHGMKPKCKIMVLLWGLWQCRQYLINIREVSFSVVSISLGRFIIWQAKLPCLQSLRLVEMAYHASVAVLMANDDSKETSESN